MSDVDIIFARAWIVENCPNSHLDREHDNMFINILRRCSGCHYTDLKPDSDSNALLSSCGCRLWINRGKQYD